MEEFEKNRRKVKHCPCGKSNADGKFAPFAGKTNEGYCHSCCKTFSNKEYKPSNSPSKKVEKKVISMTHDNIKRSQENQGQDRFSMFLLNKYGSRAFNEVSKLYSIGLSNRWQGATVFWYIDSQWNVRTGKIMLYDSETGRRVQNPKPRIDWAHSGVPKEENEVFRPCLFGEHLINVHPHKPIALVESEKTAVISSLYFPQFNWLATGGSGGLKLEKLQPILHKKIVFFPDLDAHDKWSDFATQLKQLYNIKVSTYLHENSSENEKSSKFDLSDYLLQYQLCTFKTH